MKETITHRMVSKEWGRILTKPLDRAPRISYKRTNQKVEIDLIFKALGWKKHGEQQH